MFIQIVGHKIYTYEVKDGPEYLNICVHWNTLYDTTLKSKAKHLILCGFTLNV